MAASAEQFATEPLRYRGSHSHYVDIAVRGTDEHLGLGVEYAVHPSGVGCFILRFVVHSASKLNPANYKHFAFRESAKFVIPDSGSKYNGEVIRGVRLNKIAIPVFEPAVQRHEVEKFAAKFGIFQTLTEWVAEQVQAEGFNLTVNLQKEIEGLVLPPTTSKEVKSVVQYPDLKNPDYQKQVLKQAKPPVDDEPEEEDEDEEDEDDSDDKEWLN